MMFDLIFEYIRSVIFSGVLSGSFLYDLSYLLAIISTVCVYLLLIGIIFRLIRGAFSIFKVGL